MENVYTVPSNDAQTRTSRAVSLIPPVLNLNNTRPGAHPSCGGLDSGGGGIGRSDVDGVSADIADGLLLILSGLDTVGGFSVLSLLGTLGDGLGLGRGGLLLLLGGLDSLAGLTEKSTKLVGLGLGVGLGTVRSLSLLFLLGSEAAEHGSTALVLGGDLGGLRCSSSLSGGSFLGLLFRLGLGLGFLLSVLLHEAKQSTLGGRRSGSLSGLGGISLGGGGDALRLDGLGCRRIDWVTKLGSSAGDGSVLVLVCNRRGSFLLCLLSGGATDLLEDVAEDGSTLVLGGGLLLRLGLGLFILLLIWLSLGGLSSGYFMLA